MSASLDASLRKHIERRRQQTRDYRLGLAWLFQRFVESLYPQLLTQRVSERRVGAAGMLPGVLQRSPHDRPLEKPIGSTTSGAPP
jgi:hypothetical protein